MCQQAENDNSGPGRRPIGQAVFLHPAFQRSFMHITSTPGLFPVPSSPAAKTVLLKKATVCTDEVER